MAATPLALLPFLAAGQTHKTTGPYRKTIARGLVWLLRKQKADGSFEGMPEAVARDAVSMDGKKVVRDDTMYSHGLATLTLCEASGLSGDRNLAKAAQAAVEFIEAAQDKSSGGWRYKPGGCGDTSVTGLQITALRSAQLAGLKVKPETLQRAGKWLASVSHGGKPGEFSYAPGTKPGPSMTAVGLMGSLYLGAEAADPPIISGEKYLLDHLPDANDRNVYYWYYGTAALHECRSPGWDQWRRTLAKVLISTQVKAREECACGSWDPDKPTKDACGAMGGRHFVTALSVLSLEVYYQYLGLWKPSKSSAPAAPPKLER